MYSFLRSRKNEDVSKLVLDRLLGYPIYTYYSAFNYRAYDRFETNLGGWPQSLSSGNQHVHDTDFDSIKGK